MMMMMMMIPRKSNNAKSILVNLNSYVGSAEKNGRYKQYTD